MGNLDTAFDPSAYAPISTAVPKWQPSTAYSAGQQVVSPNGDIVSAIATFTSGASYSAANWNLSPSFTPATSVMVPSPTGVASTDTANLQAALNKASNGNPKNIVMQAGKYTINAELAFPFAPGTRLIGQGREVTIIEQQTAGANIIGFRLSLTHTITLQDFTLQYNVAQTTPSAAVFYDVAGGTNAGFFHHAYKNLKVNNAYNGFQMAESDGQQTLWDVYWDNIVFANMANSLVRMTPQTAVGVPAITLRNIASNSAPTVSGAVAFAFTACEVNMDGIDLENWIDTGIQATGGGFLRINNLHVEHHSFNSSVTSRVLYVANGPVSIDGWTLAGALTANCTATAMFVGPGSGCQVTLRNGSHNVTTTAGTAYVKEVVYGGAGVAGVGILVENVIKAGGGFNNPGQGNQDIIGYLSSVGYLPNGQNGIQGQRFIFSDGGGLLAASASNRYQMQVVPGNGGYSAPVLTLGATASTGGTFTAGTYFWKVTGIIKGGAAETIGSNEVTATLLANGTQALSWAQPPNYASMTGYNIYRGTSAGNENVLVGTVNSNTTLTFTDTGAAGSAASIPALRADTLYMCVQSSAGTYSWKPVVVG